MEMQRYRIEVKDSTGNFQHYRSFKDKAKARECAEFYTLGKTAHARVTDHDTGKIIMRVGGPMKPACL